jgi:hypothetical protein
VLSGGLRSILLRTDSGTGRSRILFLQEFPVSSSLHDFPVPQNEDEVSIADGAQAVGDDEGRPPSHEVEHCVLDEALGVGVDVTCGFIKNEDCGVFEEGTGDGEELALSLTQVFSPPRRGRYRTPRGGSG